MLSRFALSVVLAGLGLAQDPAAARMNQLMQSYVTDRKFMGTALVARGSQVLFSKGAPPTWNGTFPTRRIPNSAWGP